jgi:hypothetical protein
MNHLLLYHNVRTESQLFSFYSVFSKSCISTDLVVGWRRSQLKQEIQILLLTLDSSRSRLSRYFGCDYHVIIPFNIEILCTSCFSRCESLSSISFENDSRLMGIKSPAFASSRLKSIAIPQGVEILCS